MIGDVEPVLREARHQHNDFVAGIEDRLENHVASARGTDRHEDIFGGELQAGLPAQLLGDGLAHLRVAGIGHVAMRTGTAAGDNPPQRFEYSRWRFHIRIAEREIEDRVGAALALQAHAFLEHAANPGGVFKLLGDGL